MTTREMAEDLNEAIELLGLPKAAADELCKITCPTLVIGGKEDRIATGEASEEIAELIPGSMLHMYEGLGHGLYEEAPDFLERIMDFCK